MLPSGIVLGLWTISGDWGAVDDEVSLDLLRRAPELGVEWVDTAPIYGRGHADEVLAKALAEGVSLRVATKVGPRFVGGHPQSDLSPEHVRADLDASLQRLGIDHVDLVQAHWPCERGTPLPETVEALDALVHTGKAGAWGLCNYPASVLATCKPATHQAAYSMMRREVEHDGVRDMCVQRAIRLLAYETLGRGLLAGRHRTLPRFQQDDMRKRDPRFWGNRFYRTARNAELLRQLSAKHDVPVAALATGWVLTRPGVSATIVGARNIQQLTQVLHPVPDEARGLLGKIADRFR